MAVILDDIDARPGSVASLLRTVVGLYLRPIGGWIAAAELVALMGSLGVDAPQARTGIARLRSKGLLIADRRTAAGYALNPAAIPMLERGDRRIFGAPQMGEGDPWCLVSFSISEDQREARGRLRRRLQWIGAGSVAPGLWILPGHLADEAEGILDDLGLRAHATLFLTAPPRVAGSLGDAVAHWWDLDALAEAHRGFLERIAALSGSRADAGRGEGEDEDPGPRGSGPRDPEERDPERSFADYVRLVDSWRPIPYIDPGLPAALLQADWPGLRSAAEFGRLSGELAGPAWARVRAIAIRR